MNFPRPPCGHVHGSIAATLKPPALWSTISLELQPSRKAHWYGHVLRVKPLLAFGVLIVVPLSLAAARPATPTLPIPQFRDQDQRCAEPVAPVSQPA